MLYPATVRTPVRATLPVLLAMKNLTVPFPLPGLPDVTVNHETLLVAVHGQPPAQDTATDPLYPPVAAVTLPMEIE